MREELELELIMALQPYISPEKLPEIKMAITIAVSKFDVELSETGLTVWEGDKNELIMKRFIAAKIAKGCSIRTVSYYKEIDEAFFRKIGKNYDDVTPDDIRVYLAVRVHQDGVSKTTANNERRCLSSFYTWLQKEEILLKNPMAKVDSIKITKKKKEEETKMEMLDKTEVALVAKILGEVLTSITWEDLNELITAVHVYEKLKGAEDEEG